jgi:hypothetical protein
VDSAAPIAGQVVAFGLTGGGGTKNRYLLSFLKVVPTEKLEPQRRVLQRWR